MTGNASPAGQVLGASTTGASATAVLANTGNPFFQSILVGVIILSVALLLTRLVKATVN